MHDSLVPGLRVELRRLVTEKGARRILPPVCFVGRPGGRSVRLLVDGPADPALRADLVERALDGPLDLDRACAWLTRTGDLGLTDADAAWFSAACTGFARHGLRLPAFAVLNGTGWVDLVSGERREWGRIRRSRATAARRA